jgi:predicted dehydrogenase
MRKIRMGMVGGGRDAFIGAVHRMAAALDSQIELVCGAFSSNAEKSKLSGADLFLPANRVYANYEEMILSEKKLSKDKRMDFVAIVTPNHVHFEPAKLALKHGFHVMCDKPLCLNMKEALELEKLARKSGLLFGLTHTYSGYPMVKQAKAMIKNGTLGNIRKVVVEYPQGWLSTKLEDSDQKQASWRNDPARSGMGGAVGDIGTHAEHLAEYVTGLKISELCADVSSVVEGRLLDDDCNVLLHFDNGARGILYASQISAGEENNLKIRVYGEKGGIEWHQMEPNTLTFRPLEGSMQVLRTGVGNLSPEAQAHTRVPAGHPEGYVEAFANIYRNFAKCIQARLEGVEVNPLYLDFPSIEEGVRGMQFIEAVVNSGKSNKKWIALK